MIAYISGRILFKSPTQLTIDVNGLGYEVNISLHTYGQLGDSEAVRLHTYLSIREDAQVLYGFADLQEKEMFMLLIGVQGIGPNTARTILSSATPEELQRAISQGDEPAIRRIKGLGPKTAQRIIIELRDKVIKIAGQLLAGTSMVSNNNIREEALMALVTLGFPKPQMEKILNQLMQDAAQPLSVEELIKKALRSV
ncbi:MAG: Holliday junction branch migration protein RuvA [Bacteroidia bacterium]